MKHLIVALLILMLAGVAAACEIHRSKAEVNRFKRTHVCPATHTVLQSGQSCKGYVVDHIVALCDGGPDLASNMQYQTITAAKHKDRTECHSAAWAAAAAAAAAAASSAASAPSRGHP